MYGGGYAAAEVQAMKGSGFLRAERRRLNLVAIVQNVLAPWLLFCVVYGLMSFFVHYKHPTIAFFLVFVCLTPVIAAGWVASRAMIRRGAANAAETFSATGMPQRASDHPDAPSWLISFFLAMSLAWIMGMVVGDINFFWNMQPFYDLETLNAYPSVDPSVMKGKEMMDVGRIFFTKDSKLDLNRAMAFKNTGTYCVAPITKGATVLESYDFWVVGMDCCSGTQKDFHCGEVNNPQAKAGLRLMYDDQRPFFRLAVQQAEAMYNIKATHPLFFHWMQDPNAAVNEYRERGMRWYLVGIFGHFCFSLFCVACATVAFSKVGYY